MQEVYSPEFVQESVQFAKENPLKFIELTLQKTSISERDICRSMHKWGIKLPAKYQKHLTP